MGDAALDLYADDLENSEFQNNVSVLASKKREKICKKKNADLLFFVFFLL